MAAEEERSGEEDEDRRIRVEGWRKMEAAAQNRAQDGQEWSMFHPPGATVLKKKERNHKLRNPRRHVCRHN